MVSSTKSGAIRSVFDKEISLRRGWIFRERDLLIRNWGNVLNCHILFLDDYI
jgi:hypothetical protein